LLLTIILKSATHSVTFSVCDFSKLEIHRTI